MILTLAGFLSRWGLVFDLAAHFRLQYLLLQLLCLVLCVLQKQKKLFYFVIVFFLINLSLIAPFYIPTAKSDLAIHPIRILFSNVNIYNTNYKSLSHFIMDMSPDLIALEEINERWTNDLSPVLAGYPYYKIVLRDDGFGIGIYSKIPFQNLDIKYFGEVGVPSIAGEFMWENQAVSLLFTHPVPPTGGNHLRWRNEQLANIAALSSLNKNIILLGDLNTTSWSGAFQNLIKQLGLKDSRRGFGLQTSWPSFLPYIGVTIDHCLVSKNIVVVNRTVGPNIGSDHLPVFIQLAIPTPSLKERSP